MSLFPKIPLFRRRELTEQDERTILWLWDQKLDTVEIAHSLRTREAEVYNRLTPLRWARLTSRDAECKST